MSCVSGTVKSNHPARTNNDERSYKITSRTQDHQPTHRLAITHNRQLLIIMLIARLLSITTKRTITQHGILGKILYVDFSSGVPVQVVRLVRTLIVTIMLFSFMMYVPSVVYNLLFRTTYAQYINSNVYFIKNSDISYNKTN